MPESRVNRPLRVFISAAETSSDLHGAELLKALRAELPEVGSVEAFGMGGPHLQAAGLHARVDARELMVMGFTEVVAKLPTIRRALVELESLAREQKPDVAVLLDYPGFHFKLMRKLHRLGIPIVYYIPPKVWVWKRARIWVLKALCARILCIFPFERAVYAEAGIEQARYVGNPLFEELPWQATREESRARLGLPATAKVLAVMPGSRAAEIRRHLDIFLEGAVRAAAKMRAASALGPHEKLWVCIPFPDTADFVKMQAAIQAWRTTGGWDGNGILEFRVSQGDSGWVLKAADAGLIKSGTSTLEAAIQGLPQVVAYRMSALTEFLFRNWVRYRGPVGLVNLVAGAKKPAEYLARELIMGDMTSTGIGDELVRLLSDAGANTELRTRSLKLREELTDQGRLARPSEVAAQEVLAVARAGKSAVE